MRFRINIYLKLCIFLKALFLSRSNIENKIAKIIKINSKKKNFNLTSQCRISFLILLEYLKKKFPHKNNIIFLNYNLPEMPNIAKNLDLNLIFNKVNNNQWFFNFELLKKQIGKNTLAIVLTNMFNTSKDSMRIKKFCKKNNIILIEDNAIYFDNFFLQNKKKIYSGTFGDYTLYSFNLMKNISALYGGGIASNDKNFNLFIKNYQKKFEIFPAKVLFKQFIIFIILKFLSNNFLYKYFFFKIIKLAHFKKVKKLLNIFYPSLKFRVIRFPKYYFTKISTLSVKLIFLQLNDIWQRRINFKKRLEKNKLYYYLLKKEKLENIVVPNITEETFQNFIDFPILVKNKKRFIKHMLNNNIEVRAHYYKDCIKIFSKQKNYKINFLEKNLVCLPNHLKINKLYIKKIVKNIKNFNQTI